MREWKTNGSLPKARISDTIDAHIRIRDVLTSAISVLPSVCGIKPLSKMKLSVLPLIQIPLTRSPVSFTVFSLLTIKGARLSNLILITYPCNVLF